MISIFSLDHTKWATKAWYIKNDIQHKTHTVRSESIHAFAFIHHYNGFEIKQPRCDWIADLKLYFKRFHKNITFTI